MSLLSPLMTQTATAEKYLGSSPTGPKYAAPVTVRGFLDDGLMRTNEPGGAQVVAKTSFFTDLANADQINVNTRLTTNGVAHLVTAVRRREGGPLLAGVAHLEVDLT